MGGGARQVFTMKSMKNMEGLEFGGARGGLHAEGVEGMNERVLGVGAVGRSFGTLLRAFTLLEGCEFGLLASAERGDVKNLGETLKCGTPDEMLHRKQSGSPVRPCLPFSPRCAPHPLLREPPPRTSTPGSAESGKRKAESGKRKVESGKWKVENGRREG